MLTARRIVGIWTLEWLRTRDDGVIAVGMLRGLSQSPSLLVNVRDGRARRSIISHGQCRTSMGGGFMIGDIYNPWPGFSIDEMAFTTDTR